MVTLNTNKSVWAALSLKIYHQDWNTNIGGGPIRGTKRGGAREHYYQKEMDRIYHCRRIWDKSTALVTISVNRVIYQTFTDGPNKMNSSSP